MVDEYNNMKIAFSFHLYDDEGDMYENALLLHFHTYLILKLKNRKELDSMISNLQHIKKEIDENYPNED